MLTECGKTLVEPGVRPVATRDVVTEPLVRQLVRHQITGADVEGCALVQHDVLVQRGGGGVLHPAENEIAHHGLRVARPWKVDTEALGKQLQHARRFTQATRRVSSLPDRHQVPYRYL